jgi:hypothetical protein
MVGSSGRIGARSCGCCRVGALATFLLIRSNSTTAPAPLPRKDVQPITLIVSRVFSFSSIVCCKCCTIAVVCTVLGVCGLLLSLVVSSSFVFENIRSDRENNCFQKRVICKNANQKVRQSFFPRQHLVIGVISTSTDGTSNDKTRTGTAQNSDDYNYSHH